MKNIMVLGATERIGKLLLPLLTTQENKVTAYVRNPEKAVGSSFDHVTIFEDCMDRLALVYDRNKIKR